MNNEINEAFSSIYNEYYVPIYKFCLAKLNCNDDYASDAVQDTFMVLYKKMRAGEIIENPRALLYTTAYVFIKKRYGIIKTEQSRLTELDEARAVSYDDMAEKLDFEEFTKAVDSILNDEEKTLYELRFVNGERVKDISERLGIEKHYCSLKLTRLRRKIATLLSDYR